MNTINGIAKHDNVNGIQGSDPAHLTQDKELFFLTDFFPQLDYNYRIRCFILETKM